MGARLKKGQAKEIIERFAKKQRGGRFACPRCGRRVMDEDVTRNALSRYANVYVCDACGSQEAFGAMVKRCTPVSQWSIATNPGRWGMVISGGKHIAIDGREGTWYVIDEGDFILTPDTDDGQPLTIHAHLFLLEHEQYGDEVAHIIVDDSGSLILEDVWNGFGDLAEAGWAAVATCDAHFGKTQSKRLEQ